MNCRTEFGPEYAVPFDVLNVLLASGWEDTSWSNDACPTFRHDVLGLVLWCDAERMEDRETRGPRFVLTTTDGDGSPTDEPPLFTSEDVPALFAYLLAVIRTANRPWSD